MTQSMSLLSLADTINLRIEALIVDDNSPGKEPAPRNGTFLLAMYQYHVCQAKCRFIYCIRYKTCEDASRKYHIRGVLQAENESKSVFLRGTQSQLRGRGNF